MSRKQQSKLGWLAGALLIVGAGAMTFLLIGATEQADEVLMIDVAVHVDEGMQAGFVPSGDRSVYACLAVSSPTRGAVEQLRSGNIRVYDPIYGPGGIKEHTSTGWYSVTLDEFVNLGGGYY